MAKQFIQKAIHCKGCLHAYAKKHRLLNKDGTINLARAHEYATKHHNKLELKRIHLAHTLESFHNPHERSIESKIKRM